MESRPIELHREGESEARVEESAMSHHQTWDALVLKGSDWEGQTGCWDKEKQMSGFTN